MFFVYFFLFYIVFFFSFCIFFFSFLLLKVDGKTLASNLHSMLIAATPKVYVHIACQHS